MEAGTLVEWLKQPGDEVKHGDIIAVVETDKGAIEVEVFEDGRLAKLLVEPGRKVPVGTPLAEIAGAGVPSAESPPKGTATAVPRKREPKPAIAAPAPAMPPLEGLHASPAARSLAEKQGIDLAGIEGSGPGGAIQRKDVLAAAATRPSPAAGPDLASMRRAIAAAMARSKREIPHYFLSHSFDVSAAQDWLEAYNARHPAPERLLFGALLMKAAALALREFPEFNGYFEKDGFVPSEAIHIGMAISLRGGGLIAPAIHDTDKLQLEELMTKMRDLVGRVRKGSFRSSEISDPTVTVSSLGERGVEVLLPIIYPPQVAIIGFGTVLARPWAAEDEVVVRPVITATLAADHRASDGHRGALLLRRIAELLEQPEAL
jgi:pyruvate dehydrogenase E2 component (dihydrolipoamide acetyltransferase)